MDVNTLSFEMEIERIRSQESVQAVFLTGAAAGELCDFSKLRDIDIFVILPKGQFLEREVADRGGVTWDITYLPINLLKQGIKEKWPFLILGLYKSKPIIIEDVQVDYLLAEIQSISLQGPGALTEEELKYLRFKLAQDYEDLYNRRKDAFNSKFLAYNLFKEILIAYFNLNNRWVPREKKMLAAIKEEKDLYNVCVKFLEEKNVEKSLSYLQNMIKYVLNPWGGTLINWPKGKFPLK
ncbi:MAG: hypothetical protein JM58_08900 [Peptococcaceae bacterium BICA1-8]|nr:MAG: hypothetical protein JM58_08900 [Peptococcaceae bacterium BICA1-8]